MGVPLLCARRRDEDGRAWNETAFSGEEYKAQYDEEQDEFCFGDGGLEDWDRFGHKIVQSAEGPLKVYPIGAYCWTWNEENG